MRCQFAEWRGPADSNYRQGGVVRPVRGCVLHVIVGSLAAADSVFHRPGWGASAHFGVGKDGRCFQWVDTNDRAWAQGAGNPEWISIETEGQPSEPLTNAQVSSVARLFQWGQVHGPYPYAVTDSPQGRGLGTHKMGGGAWGGHECPGAIRAAQRSLIVQAASGGAVPGPQPSPVPAKEEDDMAILVTPYPPGGQGVWVLTTQTKRWVPNPDDLAALVNTGQVGPDVVKYPPETLRRTPNAPGSMAPAGW